MSHWDNKIARQFLPKMAFSSLVENIPIAIGMTFPKAFGTLGYG
jgi:hypothetical protein